MMKMYSQEAQMFRTDWLLLPDMFDFLCGKHLGDGLYRSVYECNLYPQMVVKVERFKEEEWGGVKKDYISFNNTVEWDIWFNINHSYKQYAKFLAPCVRISSGGRILLQHKTEPVTAKELPKKIPYFLADTKLANWGRLNGRVVCHDYANHKLMSAIPKNKLITAKWHNL